MLFCRHHAEFDSTGSFIFKGCASKYSTSGWTATTFSHGWVVGYQCGLFDEGYQVVAKA